MPFSIDTSGSVDGPLQNAPADDRLVRLEMVAVGDRVLARQRPARADVLEALELRLAAADAGDPRAQHRNQPELARRRAPDRRETRARRSTCVALDVHQEHVRARRRSISTENSCEQARLQRPDADDEEGAEADGEQDDARLVAGPREVQHGVPQRKRGRRASGATARTSTRPASCSTTASAAKSGADDQADPQRRRLPGGRRRPAPADTSTIAADPRPVASGARSSRRAAAATA